MKAKQIVIEGESGYCLVEYMYTDKLILTPSSIEYEMHSSMKPPLTWSYRTTNPKFTHVFEKATKAIEEILIDSNEELVQDAGTVSFSITYMDGQVVSDIYYLPHWASEECFKIIKEIVPQIEEIPRVLKTREDYEAEGLFKLC